MHSSQRGLRGGHPRSTRRLWCVWGAAGLLLILGYPLAIVKIFHIGAPPAGAVNPTAMVRRAENRTFLDASRPPRKGLDGVKITVVSWEPRIIVADNFLTIDEVSEGLDILQDVYYGDTALVNKEGRASTVDPHTVSSKIASFPVNRDKRVLVEGAKATDDSKSSRSFLDRMNEKVAWLAQLPVSHGEQMYTLNYIPGEFFRGHLDAHAYEGKFTTSRIATVLVYLTDVPEGTGGETFFPLAHPLPFEELRDKHGFTEDVSKVDPQCLKYGQKDDKVQTQAERDNYEDGSDLLKDSDQKPGPGLMVRSRLGRAILWYNRLPNREIDLLSRHAGCPLTKGSKQTLTKWLHWHSCANGACTLGGYQTWAAKREEERKRKAGGGTQGSKEDAK